MTLIDRLMLMAGAVERAAFRLSLSAHGLRGTGRLNYCASRVERWAARVKSWAHVRTLPLVECVPCSGTGLGVFPELVCGHCQGVGEVRIFDTATVPPIYAVADRSAWRRLGCLLRLASLALAVAGFRVFYYQGPAAVLRWSAIVAPIVALLGAALCCVWCVVDTARRVFGLPGLTAPPVAVQFTCLLCVLYACGFLIWRSL